MIAVNPNSICEQARAYYYDYLCGEAREHIPAEMFAHIDKCRFCQAEVGRLKSMLAEAEARATEGTRQTTSTVVANLRLHFAYTGARVACNTVKPFLPSLAIPALDVGVPTPITVHLDKCQQCANDLEVIRQLNLDDKQLCRLSQIFADQPKENTVSCLQARAGILPLVTMFFHKTNAEVLKHLCTCSDCREQIHQYRETVLMDPPLNEVAQTEFSCDTVSTTDIFDYCFPYGVDLANDQYAKFRESLTSHLRSCPTCLGKMQQLHREVCNIAERPDSEVVTCLTCKERINEGIEHEPTDLYADWPIGVQALDKSKIEPKTSPAAVLSPRLLKQRVLALNLKRYIKPAAVAAAVILVALLLLNAPVAKAVDLGQIYKSLGRIRNVCLTTFIPEESEPTKKRWISESLGITMVKTQREWVLWDVKGKSKKSKDFGTGSITVTEPGKDILAKAKQTMDVPWGLLPFNDVSKIPPDSKWCQAADETIETTVPDTKVYELAWMNKGLGGSAIIHRKWRGYIDVKTKLPRRIEWWEKQAEETEYRLVTIIKVTYPTAVEIRAVIREAGL
ncbi:MAG: hypothetical protein ACYSTG_03495 [Planctomycetota bacterium]|jgi:hypothetical protein